jgi:hypothetical protein
MATWSRIVTVGTSVMVSVIRRQLSMTCAALNRLKCVVIRLLRSSACSRARLGSGQEHAQGEVEDEPERALVLAGRASGKQLGCDVHK